MSHRLAQIKQRLKSHRIFLMSSVVTDIEWLCSEIEILEKEIKEIKKQFGKER